MAFKRYQVSFDEAGEVLDAVELPAEEPRLRTIVVREETKNKAKKLAADLYTFAK